MLIKCIPGGSFLTNCYIIADEETKEGILIDPGSQVEEVLEEVERLGLNVKKIVNTHAHIDHVAGVEDAKKTLKAEFYLHPKEEPVLRSSGLRWQQWPRQTRSPPQLRLLAYPS